MQTTTLADEIANYAVFRLKNGVSKISEMGILEQEEVRDIIRNVEWPQKCAIYQARNTGKPVSITLWPTGKLQG